MMDLSAFDAQDPTTRPVSRVWRGVVSQFGPEAAAQLGAALDQKLDDERWTAAAIARMFAEATGTKISDKTTGGWRRGHRPWRGE